MPPWAAVHVVGLVVRDAPQAALLTMRVYYCAAKQDLILRSPPKAAVSKDGHRALFSQTQLPPKREVTSAAISDQADPVML